MTSNNILSLGCDINFSIIKTLGGESVVGCDEKGESDEEKSDEDNEASDGNDEKSDGETSGKGDGNEIKGWNEEAKNTKKPCDPPQEDLIN
ncbi:hypothetical protein BGX27_006318 [Mortierella sp. AM989]|nr:hypothetical protein BGX27_006318 [Mortierella sp. AM989]